MDTSVLKNFAQESRRYLMDVVAKKIEYYLTTDNVEIRAKKHLIEDLRKEISNTSKDQVIEKIAYTWFNRFCALRYMDVKQYSLVGVLTPMSESHTQPEILMEAKSGHIKDELGNPSSRDHVIGLLSGKVSTNDPQSEAYKHLVLMACNYYHSIMPFLFEKIDDYTELLMPDDLLSEASIVSKVRSALNEENCKDVEVIGWLYQFYISEKKDEVFEGLKKNKKITPENIPAATQLFTPNWIVRYLVENSLGRLWMLNRPSSNLISKMEYYIKPEVEEKDFLKIKGPEEIKVCDPACGSGHMLVYAFDLLYSMYEEVGIDSNEISSLILKNNLFGVEIDKRAGELAAFALTMKAREKQRRYFKNPVNPNICVLENIHFEEAEIKDYMDHVGHDLFSSQLRNTLYQFVEAKNFGSLISPEVSEVATVLNLLDQKNVSGHLFLTKTHSNVLRVLAQAKFLSPVYHVVIANPPYMGGNGMNESLKKFLENKYKKSKYDLMTAFMDKCSEICMIDGFWGMINLPSWMFLSSFEGFRKNLLETVTFSSLLHLGRGIFGSDFGSTAFVCNNSKNKSGKTGLYRRLFDQHVQVRSVEKIQSLFFDKGYGHFSINQNEFNKIPGNSFAYWLSPEIRQIFQTSKSLKEIGDTRQGMATSDNNRFLRQWYEVSFDKISLSSVSRESAKLSKKKWFPYNKGGQFRKWYGNAEYVVNWENDGKELLDYASSLYGSPTRTIKSISEYFKPSVSWSKVSSGNLAMRYFPAGFIFDVAGCAIFNPDHEKLNFLLGFCNTNLARTILTAISPTVNFEAGQIAQLPIFNGIENEKNTIPSQLIHITKMDWDSKEFSWDFKAIPLLKLINFSHPINDSFDLLIKESKQDVLKVKELEKLNNQFFINYYGLQSEVSAEVSLEEISLFYNPNYMFRTAASNEEKVGLLKLELVKEFISYGVGCIFGRYSIDKEGLILASQGADYKDFLSSVPNPRFLPDSDNVVPIIDGDWFIDDILEKFKCFLKVVAGEKNYEKNLTFLEDALGKDIKKYFFKDFYNDHIKMFRKRPIYWMFSSPQGTFNALIYLHRYNSDTVSIVLNSYLREYRAKLVSKRENLERLSNSGDASSKDKTAALKEIEQLKKMILELDEYEKDVLYPLATQRLEIDLDDGVKANYPKFGNALKPIKGLDKGED
ncbi:MAG: class I SAM-dependent DNA methyltransferase [Bdellovibrionales bacterium CG10_big_fil_rev_8_21_14_0_10_45_34]|nr:MAG: class I SAM-dependent DNA methyltransferase [Bdellovibrionales bacterium CG10_big_fil_rev_8_21_14_0_10_45_34]